MTTSPSNSLATAIASSAVEGGAAARNLESVRGENGFTLILVKSCHDALLFPLS